MRRFETPCGGRVSAESIISADLAYRFEAMSRKIFHLMLGTFVSNYHLRLILSQVHYHLKSRQHRPRVDHHLAVVISDK